MTDSEQDAQQLVNRIQRVLDRFGQASGHHQRDESFVAVDASSYVVAIKVLSPFGNGEASEVVSSTNELQQRVNYWLGVQRSLGQLGSVRLVITPELEADPE